MITICLRNQQEKLKSKFRKIIAISLGSLMLIGGHQVQAGVSSQLGQGFIVSPEQLMRPTDDSATLRISSNVPGSKVFINGHFRGETPSSSRETFDVKIAEGTYHIQLVKPIDEYHEYRGERKNFTVVDFTSPALRINLTINLTPLGIIARQEAEQNARIAREKAEAEEKARRERIDRPYIERYVVNSNGTVYDKLNDVTWMRCSLGQDWTGSSCMGRANRYRFSQAEDAAKQAHFANKTDWRLPTMDELQTLVYCSSGQQRESKLDENGQIAKQGRKQLDGGCEGSYQQPTIFSSVFPNTAVSWYWSASPALGYGDQVWAVYFHNGADSYAHRKHSIPINVRLVRTGNLQ